MPSANAQPEIFESVRACLSESFVSALCNGIKASFALWHVPGSLREEPRDSSTKYFLEGTLNDIVEARTIIEKELQLLQRQLDVVDVGTLTEENGIADDQYGVPETTVFVNLLQGSSTEGNFQDPQLGERFQLPQLTEQQQCQDDGNICVRESFIPMPEPVVIEIHCTRVEDAEPATVPSTTDAVAPSAATSTALTEGAPSTETKASNQRRKQRYEEVTPFKYFCDLCSFKTKRNSHYLKHIKIHEKVATVHTCGRCPFTTVRLGHLRRHQATHSSTLQRCSRCSYATDNQKLLLRHNRVKHRRVQGPPAQVLECLQCSYRTTRPQMLARHQQSHLVGAGGAVVSLHQCEQCSYKTRRKEHLVRHRNNVHGDARPFLCHQCGKAFKRGDALRQHHLTHTGRLPQEASFSCSQCSKTFRTQSHLTEHQATHSTVRPFLCEVCGAAFKTRSVQRKHVQTVHCNPRAFSCQVCTKKFNTQYALKRHQKLHLAAGEPHDEPAVFDICPPAPDDVLNPQDVPPSISEVLIGQVPTLQQPCTTWPILTFSTTG
ncbi:zinc finger protein 70-like [Ornithodoros turicata]|uniref:zinc finger protein 70-like n=1 Tax=Ornithodoros turicata TaxID=34597 RepID=UPI003138651D